MPPAKERLRRIERTDNGTDVRAEAEERTIEFVDRVFAGFKNGLRERERRPVAGITTTVISCPEPVGPVEADEVCETGPKLPRTP